MSDLPGGPISVRPLRFFWLLDVSGSMAGSKIDQLNHTIRETVPAMKQAADENPEAAVEVKVMTFSTGFTWITPEPVPLDDFRWRDVTVHGITDVGAALSAMATEMSVANMPERALPPVVVLVSDGQPTDDFATGLKAFLAAPWGRRASRIAIAIGSDADHETLRRFIDHPEMEPLSVANADELARYIRWASTEVLMSASAPSSSPGDGHPPVPPPPEPSSDAEKVW